MPVSSYTPLPESKDAYRSARPTDRRAASPKQKSSVTETKWPVVTQSAYVSLARGKAAEDMRNNQHIRKLCTARAKINEAMLMVHAVIHAYNPQREEGLAHGEIGRKIYNRARMIHMELEKELLRFPLEVR